MMLPDIVRDLPLIVMCSEILQSPEYFEPSASKAGKPCARRDRLVDTKVGNWVLA
jgi:hypothetical protein